MAQPTNAEIERACRIFRKIFPTDEDREFLEQLLRKMNPSFPEDGSMMTREEDQLLRESDERAAFNDQLDNMRDGY